MGDNTTADRLQDFQSTADISSNINPVLTPDVDVNNPQEPSEPNLFNRQQNLPNVANGISGVSSASALLTQPIGKSLLNRELGAGQNDAMKNGAALLQRRDGFNTPRSGPVSNLDAATNTENFGGTALGERAAFPAAGPQGQFHFKQNIKAPRKLF